MDGADYVLWRHAMQTGGPLANDTTPESVSTADYQLWRANFGQAGGAGSGLDAASVPEPMSGVLGIDRGDFCVSGVDRRPPTAGITD